MIDSYMDRADRATGYQPTPARPISEDPRYMAGVLYATMIDKHVAWAKARVQARISDICSRHRFEIRIGHRMGDFASQFTTTGRLKK